MKVTGLVAGLLVLPACASFLNLPLHVAVARNDTAEIEKILASGYDIDSKAPLNEGATALMAAAQDGSVEIVKLLIDRGAGVDIRDNRGATALMHAAFSDVSRPDKQADVATILLDHGADIDAKDERGTTALMYAAAEGKPRMAQLLLDRGAKPENTNAGGFPAAIFGALSYYRLRPASEGADAYPLRSLKIAGPAKTAYLLFPPQDIILYEDRSGTEFPLKEGSSKASLVYSRIRSGKRALGYVAVVRPGHCRLKAYYESKATALASNVTVSGKPIRLDFEAIEGKVYRLGYLTDFAGTTPSWRAWIEELEDEGRVKIVFKDIKLP